MELPRRTFIKTSASVAAAISFPRLAPETSAAEQTVTLPVGNSPDPVAFPHFPDRIHAFVWRNWTLVPTEKIAQVISATPDQVRQLGASMGLEPPPQISKDLQRRSYITVIRRNWHLLPYEQLLQLLDWDAAHMAYMLREDDFLYIKLGSLKPKCAPLRYETPSDETRQRAAEIAAALKNDLPAPADEDSEPLFQFVADLSRPLVRPPAKDRSRNSAPRFCYSYFALYGDPLLERELDPYPDGYLQRLAALGVNGVWLQAVLHKLAPFPWLTENESDRQIRLQNLRSLARRAAKHGIGIYLYLNEPRSMPVAFYEKHPEMRGVPSGDYAALCTSNPEVQQALTDAVAHVCQAVPELAGLFTITASENPTNCWSHGAGAQCPRCGKRSPGEVIAEVNSIFHRGIQKAKSKAVLIAWDWGWHDGWAPEIIEKLPAEVALMSVSEWSIPIRRGGIDSVIGEYSISTVGPGPRATRHWELARKRGLRTLAKIQAGNTWELSSVPYIPALANVARHVAQLKDAHVDGLMLGWTLGGYPSPNLQTACAIAGKLSDDTASVPEMVTHTLAQVATSRFGSTLVPEVVQAWKKFSEAFSEFPFHGGLVYNAPMQYGPANVLWPEPTGYRATMVGFPYDDLNGWRQSYPAPIFIQQFDKIADGFDAAIAQLQKADTDQLTPAQLKAFRQELDVASAAAIHFRSTANQARFVLLRSRLENEKDGRSDLIEDLRKILLSEITLARRLHQIQGRDSRIGFEASNQYFYIPQDLVEKIINCRHLLTHWLPTLTT